MNIHIDEVIDYVTCPRLYEFKHITKVNPELTVRGRPNKQSILELYDSALHKTIATIFQSIQDGFYPNLDFITRKWGLLWVKQRSDQEDIRFKQTSWRDTHEKKRIQGWEKLKLLWEHYKTDTGVPIMINYPYTVQIGKHTLHGTIDLARTVPGENGRENIEIIDFITDDKTAPFLHTRRDWKLTAAIYAFQKIMNVKAERIVYHGIISGKIRKTHRDANDFKQLEALLDSIEKVRSQELYYPVFNERCLTCPYSKHCEKG